MKRFWLLKGLRVLVFIAAGVTLAGYVVMALWNSLLPPLAGWHTISFLQALGLLVLCRLLFGGLRGRGGFARRRMRERLESLTPEERERLREGLRRRCGARNEAPEMR